MNRTEFHNLIYLPSFLISRISLNIFLISIILLSITSTSYCTTITVCGTGITKKDAVQNALRKSIEQAIGIYIESETKVNLSILNYDRITSSSAGYIKNYKILAQGKDPIEDIYKVKLEVDVDDYRIQDILLEFKNDPRFQKTFQKTKFDQRRILVIYSPKEQNSLFPTSRNVSLILNAIEDKLVGYGFRVFLPEHLSRIKHYNIQRLNSKTALQLARQENGDAIVLIDIYCLSQNNFSDGYQTLQGNICLQAFDVTTGELFANVHKSAKIFAIEKTISAIEKVLNKIKNNAIDELVEKIVKRFNTSREKFVTFVFYNYSSDDLDTIYNLFQGLNWDFRITTQIDNYMEVEVFTELDPTNCAMIFRRSCKIIKFNLKQTELKGSRIVYKKTDN